jgi:uncharacterized UPF0160 family protein
MLEQLKIKKLLKDKELILSEVGDNFTIKLLSIYRFDHFQKTFNIRNDKGEIKIIVYNYLNSNIIKKYTNLNQINYDIELIDETKNFGVKFITSNYDDILEYKINFKLLERHYKLNKNSNLIFNI